MKEFLQSSAVGKLELNKSILVHNYADFKKTDWGKEQIEKYLDRWGKLGFIEGLDREIRERCAVAMEQLAVYLITEAAENELTRPLETIGFPMIRRIIAPNTSNGFKGLNDPNSFSFEKFIKYCKELNISALEEKIEKEIMAYHKIDLEAEAVAIACDVIIDRFNGCEESFDELVDNNIKKIMKNLALLSKK